MGEILGYCGYDLYSLWIRDVNELDLDLMALRDSYVMLDDGDNVILGDSGLTHSVHYSYLKECTNDERCKEAKKSSTLYCCTDPYIDKDRIDSVLTQVEDVMQADYVCAQPYEVGQPTEVLLFKNEERKEIVVMFYLDCPNASIGDKLVDVLMKIDPHSVQSLLSTSKSALEEYANIELAYIGQALKVGNNFDIVYALCRDRPAVLLKPLDLVDMVCTLEGNRDMTEHTIDIILELIESPDDESKIHAVNLLSHLNYAQYPYIASYILDLLDYTSFPIM